MERIDEFLGFGTDDEFTDKDYETVSVLIKFGFTQLCMGTIE